MGVCQSLITIFEKDNIRREISIPAASKGSATLDVQSAINIKLRRVSGHPAPYSFYHTQKYYKIDCQSKETYVVPRGSLCPSHARIGFASAAITDTGERVKISSRQTH